MIDINTIIAQALAAAVQQALQPLQQEYANKMGQMALQIAALEQRIAALENNPAQGVDTTLEQRIAALEKHTTVLDEHGGLLEYLDNQEWFWDKIRRFTDGAVEQAIEQHCEEYDHDNYDNAVSALGGIDFDDFVKREDFRSEIEDVLNDATIKFRF